MSNRKKSVVCKNVSGVMAFIATITLALGFCCLDSIDLTVPITLIGIGYLAALICFVMKKLYFYYKREAKKDKKKAVRLENRRRETFAGVYRKISA